MEAPRISKEKIKPCLDNPNTIVIDVRRNRHIHPGIGGLRRHHRRYLYDQSI
jgi:hypothetical protein